MTMLPFNSERKAGLECGSTGAKLVQLVRRNGAFQVEHVFLEEVLFDSRIKGHARPPLDIVRQLLIHKNLSGCKTVFIANGAMENCFVILPKMGKAETDGAILLQARKLVSWESEKPVMVFVGSDFLRERAGYLVGLADWKAVKAWGRLIEASGGLMDDVTPAACAYQALARRQRWADEFPVFLVADLGATATCFYILDHQAVKFMRKVPVGGDTITKILTTVVATDGGPVQLTDLEAENVKITGYLPLAGGRGTDDRRRTTDDGRRPARSDSGRPGTTDLPLPERLPPREAASTVAKAMVDRSAGQVGGQVYPAPGGATDHAGGVASLSRVTRDAITRILTTVAATDGGPIQLTDLKAEDVKIIGYPALAGQPPARHSPDLPESRGEGGTPDDGGQTVDGGLQRTGDRLDASRPAPKRIEQMEVLARPVIERITSEIMRSVQFFTDNTGQKVNAVFLTGGTAELQILKKHLETSVGMPVRVIDPFAGMTFANPGIRNYAEKHGARLAMATGLALAEQPAISLLPRHVHLMKRAAAFMPKAVAAVLILGFLPLLAAGTYQTVKIKLLRLEIRQYQPSLQQAVLERTRLDTLQKQCQESSEYVRTLQNMLGRKALWPGMLNALADAIPPDVVLTRCGAGVDPHHPDTILLEGKVLASAAKFDDAMASMLSALGASVFFKKVNIIKAQATSAESLLGKFEIQCELVH